MHLLTSVSATGENVVIELKIEAMKCGGCANSVTRTVKAVDPDAKVDIDLNVKRVTIDSDMPIDAFKRELAGAGFPAA